LIVNQPEQCPTIIVLNVSSGIATDHRLGRFESLPYWARTFCRPQFNDVGPVISFMRVRFNAADLAVNLAALRLQTGFAASRKPRPWMADAATAPPAAGVVLVTESDHACRYPVSLEQRELGDDPDRDRLQSTRAETLAVISILVTIRVSNLPVTKETSAAGDCDLESGWKQNRSRWWRAICNPHRTRCRPKLSGLHPHHHCFWTGFKGARGDSSGAPARRHK